MGLVKAIKDTFLNGSSSDIGENPQDNPYYEAVCARIPVDIIDEKTVVEFRWIKNKEAKIKGAYAVFCIKESKYRCLFLLRIVGHLASAST